MLTQTRRATHKTENIMPEIVKYERIETAETDLHAAQPDEDDDIINHQRISDGISGNHNGTTIVSSLESRIEMPIAARYRFNMAQKTAATAALILFYFCLSIGLTFYQRWVLTVSSIPLCPKKGTESAHQRTHTIYTIYTICAVPKVNIGFCKRLELIRAKCTWPVHCDTQNNRERWYTWIV